MSKQGSAQRNSFEKKHNRSNSKSNNKKNNNPSTPSTPTLSSNSGSGNSTNGSGMSASSTGNGSGNSNNVVTSQLNLLNDEELQAHLNDRLLYLIINSIGAQVNILTNSGVVIKGILQNIDPKTLKIIIKDHSGDDKNQLKSFNYEDLLEFEVENVDLFNNSYVKNSSTFQTDQDIGSRKSNNTPRQEIEKWVPDADLNLSLDQLTFDDGDNSKNWDQFQTNEEKFGIKSEFDEELYTTKINKNDPNYKKNLEKANKIAAEIESQSTNGNIHLAEERGLKFDDSGVDEEDKYSGVDRSISAKDDALFQSLINKDSKNFQFGNDGKSKYVPPNQRSKIQNIDPSIVSATNNGKENIKSKASPSSQPAQVLVAPKQPLPSKPQTLEKQTKAEAKNDALIPPKPQIIKEQAKESKKPETSSSSKNEKKSVPEHLRKLNTINEINALKEFSQTFKIPSKFPQDLLPILAKDKTKQDEIIKKLENNKESSTTPKPATPTLSYKKIGDPAKTQTFKLNPKAAAFTPSSANTTPSSTSNVSTPVFSKNSPRLSNTSNVYGRSKRYNPSSFFPSDRIPNVERQKKRELNKDFNFFKGCLNEFEKKFKVSEVDKDVKFNLEKPFHTPPTWNRDEYERPYKSFFNDADTLKFTRMMPSPMQPAPIQQFQPYPMMQQPPPFLYPPQSFIPQHQTYMQLSPQPQPPSLQASSASPSGSPYQQQRPIYGAHHQHHQHSYHPGASMPYQPNRYVPNTPLPPQSGYMPSYPAPGSSGIPTPVIPMNQLNQGPPPPQLQPPNSSGHPHNRGYKNY